MESSNQGTDDKLIAEGEFSLNDQQLSILEGLKPQGHPEQGWKSSLRTLKGILNPRHNDHDKSKLWLCWASFHRMVANSANRIVQCGNQNNAIPETVSTDNLKAQIGSITRPKDIPEVEWQILKSNLESLLAITESDREKLLLLEGFKILHGIRL